MFPKVNISRDSWFSLLLMAGAFALVVGMGAFFTLYKKDSGLNAPARNALKAADEHSAAAQKDSLVIEPQDGMVAVLSMIKNASSSIELVMYDFDDPQIEQALVNAYKRGVVVRVLLNQGYYGKPSIKNQVAYMFLQSQGVPVHWTSSVFALTHEKSLLVDARGSEGKALIMTFNLNPKYYATSRDFGIVDTDSADVAAIDATFEADWQGAARASSPANSANPGDDLVWSSDSNSSSKPALLSLLNGAKKRLNLYNEEMADQEIIQALMGAAKRGVSVEVVMAYSSKWKDAFAELSFAGVQVRTFKRKKPLYIHAKAIVADEQYVFVGSQNFSPNSLTKNRELGLIISNPTIAAQLLKVFRSDWNNATAFVALNS